MVAGATGFAGALAANLIHRHPDFELAAVTARSQTGRRLDDVYPRYRVPLTLEPLDLDRHGDADAAIVAYPHGASAPVVAAFHERGVRVIDLSADFRLRDRRRLRATGTTTAPAPRAPRRRRLRPAPSSIASRSRRRRIVACPGCYPTAALLALAPLAEAGLITDVVIDAKQGVSGAGREPTEKTHFVRSPRTSCPTGSAPTATCRRSTRSWPGSAPR